MLLVLALSLVVGLLCAVTPTETQRHYSKCGGCNPRITKIDVFNACRFNRFYTTNWKCCDGFVKQDKWCWRKACGGCGNGVLEPCSDIVASWEPKEKRWKLSRLQRCCKAHHLQNGKCKKLVADFPCGIARPKPDEIFPFQKRVIKGGEAYYGQFPWHVSIHTWNTDNVVCGGTLISTTKVLTAAHCQGAGLHTDFTVRIGNHNRKKNETWEKRYSLESITEHPRYNKPEHDLSIWTLRGKVDLSSFRMPACLPVDGHADYVGKLVNVSGWGRYKHVKNVSEVDQDEHFPDNLQHGQMEVIPFKNCSNRPIYKNLTKNFLGLCVKDRSPEKVRACTGDSGSGLMLYDEVKQRYTVIGVFSFGRSDCHPFVPSVFASLTGEHLQWIENELERT